MACEAGAFTGRDVVVYYAIGFPNHNPPTVTISALV